MSARKCKQCNALFSIKLDSCPHCGKQYADAAPVQHQGDGRQPILKRYPLVTCEIQTCNQEAWVLSSGRNLCVWHYEREHQPQTIAYAGERNLRTVRDHIEHCKRLARSLFDVKEWPRERMIEQWRNVLSGECARRSGRPKPFIADIIANQALTALHAKPDREPGED
jgi:hypothetical protein